MNLSNWANLETFFIRFTFIFSLGSPNAIFSAIVPSFKKIVCGTCAISEVQYIDFYFYLRISSTMISPSLGESNPINISKSVLLPLPVSHKCQYDLP